MSELNSQADELRTLADKLRSVRFDDRANYVENVETLYMSMGAMREAADTIENLAQKVEDLKGMLGELPPEGKCAMLLVKQVGGEYIEECAGYEYAGVPTACPTEWSWPEYPSGVCRKGDAR